MGNLISVSEHSDWLEENYTTSQTKWHLHRLRVEFGKQPLSIEMFIPCKLVDGVWVVLEEPESLKGYYETDSKGMKQEAVLRKEYQEAKKRCLFEGFRIEKHQENNFSVRDENDILNVMWNFSDDRGWFPSKGISTIEDLVKYKPKLTATAQKQIGL